MHGEIDRSTRIRIAEDIRLLHDTAINTLLAIANGIAGTVSLDAVRRQCASDVAALGSLTGRSIDRPDTRRASLQEVFDFPGLPIRRTGLDDEQLDRLVERLPTATVRALQACAREAITNASKHSGSFEIEVGYARRDGQLSLTVKDDGIGFDRTASSLRGRGYGLANSIFGRAADNGITVGLHTAHRAGTEIVLRMPITGDASGSDHSARTPRTSWLEAGLEPAIRLLAGIADGDLDPGSPRVRDACRREEAYLRQFTLIGPELVHLGRAVIAALPQARARGVSLSLNLGSQDTPDPAIASQIGRAIVTAVRRSPRRSTLVATIFPARHGMQLTLIGPRAVADSLSGLNRYSTLVHRSRQHVSRTTSLAQFTFGSTSSTSLLHHEPGGSRMVVATN